MRIMNNKKFLNLNSYKMKKVINTSFLLILLGLLVFPQYLLNGQSCDNLISYWRFEESSGNTYADIIGGHDAIASVSAPTREDGKVGKAQSFNGTTNYVTISDHPDFDWSGSESFTVEMWIKLKSIASSENMVFIGRDELPGSIHWWVGAEKVTGKPMFTLINSSGTSSIIVGNQGLVIGTWYHIVAVRDAATGNNLLFVNNALKASANIDYSSGDFGTDASIDVGVLNYNGSPNRFWSNVVVDELAIYSAALSITDIEDHYTNGLLNIGYCEGFYPYMLSVPDTLAAVNETFTYDAHATGYPLPTYSLVTGPGSINPGTGVYTWTPTSISQSGSVVTIAATNTQGTVQQTFRIYVAEEADCPDGIQHMYKLNETSGAPYVDFTGGNDGEAPNAPTAVAGKFDGAQDFDGVNDGINLPDDGTFNYPASSSFTFEFWLKTSGGASKNMICLGRQGTIGATDTSDLHLWVGVLTSGQAAFYVRDAHGHEPAPNGLISGGDVDDNIWHHVVAVRDGVTKINYLYVDGSEVAASDPFEYNNSFGTFPGDPFNLGFLSRPNKLPDYFFDGSLDELAIYNRALSSSEVSSNYVKSFSGNWHCQPGNFAPIFTTDPVTVGLEDEMYTYNIVTNDADPDDVLFLSIIEKPDWLTFTDLGNGRGTLSGTPGDAEIGDHSVSLSVSDGKNPITQDFTISVSNQNDPPEITSSPVTSVMEDAAYSYTVEATDPDVGAVLTYSAPTLPSWLLFNAETHVLSGTPGNGDVGDSDVVIEVTDGLSPVQQPFTITVTNVNDVPMVTGQGTISANEDQAFVISLSDLTVVDVDNDEGDLTLVIENGLNYTFAETTITPNENYNGTLIVNLHVDDLEGSGDSFGATVTVNPVNDAPVLTSEPGRNAVVGTLYGFVMTATDPDGDDLIKSAVSVPSFLEFDPVTGILGGTPMESDIGDHIVALNVTDGSESVPLNFTLTVTMWPVGVDDENSLVQKVYPVPADNLIHFNYSIVEDGVITIYDLTGKQHIEKKIVSSRNHVSIDISSLDEGLYLYKIRSGESSKINTFIISR